MTRFNVPEMSCGHCTAAIKAAIKKTDDGANITFDLDHRTVDVDSTASKDAVVAAMAEAGYEVQTSSA